MNAVVYPCTFTSTICEIFNCSNRAAWYVGRADGPASTSFRICDACAKHMIANAPAVLIDGERDIRAELEGIFNAKVLAMETQYQEKVDKLLKNLSDEKINQQIQPSVVVESLQLDQPEPDKKPVNEGIFRCLDCDKEFDNKRALSNHMRIHEGVKA